MQYTQNNKNWNIRIFTNFIKKSFFAKFSIYAADLRMRGGGLHGINQNCKLVASDMLSSQPHHGQDSLRFSFVFVHHDDK